MPNWCDNQLEVTGSKKDVKEFWEKSQGKPPKWPMSSYDFNVYENHKFLREMTKEEKEAKIKQQDDEYNNMKPKFCFNALYPVPEDIIKIGFDGGAYYRDRGIDPNSGGEGIFGHQIDGYHWCIKYWGTKWDIYHSDSLYAHGTDALEDDGIPDDVGVSLYISFETAWSSPSEWLQHIAPLFPDLEFTLRYFEPGCGFAGEDTFINGEFNSNYMEQGIEYIRFIRDNFDDEYGCWEDGDRECKKCNSIFDSDDSCPYCGSEEYTVRGDDCEKGEIDQT